MKTPQPTKEAVRRWMTAQVSSHKPPPTIEQIRRELGWGLIVVAKN